MSIKSNNRAFRDTGQGSVKDDLDLVAEKGQDPTPHLKTKRMSITLTGDSIEHLEFLSNSQGITQNEALKKAIATEVYIRKHLMIGVKVLLQNPDGEIREVVFR
jgi:hypothetical protein